MTPTRGHSLRIAHVTATFPPYYAGTGNVCYHNARLLAERGHQVTVLTARWPGTPDDPPGVTVKRLPGVVQVGNAVLLPGLIPALRRFDLIHLHYPFIGGGDLTALLARVRRIPLVVTYHNDLRAPGLRGAMFSLYERTAARAILGAARRIAVVADGYGEASPLLRRLSPLPGRVVELPNGVDAEAFRPGLDGSAVRARFGVPATAVVLLFAGGLDTAHHFKRVDLLLRAVASVRDRELWTLIAGDGDLRPQFEALAAALGIAERVRFTGGMAHRELPRVFAAADALVLPSDGTESFGMVLIEAMATGIPVIATDLPGVRDVVDRGRDGFLATPGDLDSLTGALSELVSLPDARRWAMGAQGRAKVERRYAWPRIGDQLEALYAEVLAVDDRRPDDRA